MPIRLLALLFFAGVAAAAPQPPPSPTPSVVYKIRNPAAIARYRTDTAVVRRMVDQLVVAVTGQKDLGSAWRSLVTPEDKVGIKICAAGGELFTTHRDVVEAIVEGLATAGHRRDRIIVWDRNLSGAKEAGYRPSGYQLVAIDPVTGYDPTAGFSAPVLGKLVWGDLNYIPHRGANPISTEKENTSTESHFAKILTTRVTKIINVPIMSDSGLTGLAGCLYNMTLPNIDNWRRFGQFGGAGASSMAAIYGEPALAGKVVLHLMDGLIAAYAAGPEAHPNYAVHEATLLASKDPVAIDTLALARLEQLRSERRMPAIGELAAHVQIAGQMGLGQADRAKIVVKELGR